MKKEIVIASLFTAMLAVSIINISVLSELTSGVSRSAEFCADAALAGDWDAAERYATEAFTRWENHSGHTKIVLRHNVIESGENALITLLTEIYSRDAGRALGAAEAVRRNMESISDVERIRVGSIF
ncbi:MAG: DUF4363 family protein [Oscillospiraceae bacterium]|jgi:hypothetical protein|nr:DUF4363 family protein [Oscillospiraceae bacterium]